MFRCMFANKGDQNSVVDPTSSMKPKETNILQEKLFEDATSTAKCMICGHSFFQILKHLRASSCKKYYPNDELDELKQNSEAKIKENKLMRKKSSHDSKILKIQEKINCMVCQRPFAKKALLNHLAKSKNCKDCFPLGPLKRLKNQSHEDKETKQKTYTKIHYDPVKRSNYNKERHNHRIKTNFEIFMYRKRKGLLSNENRSAECQVCHQFFSQNAILNHIEKSSCRYTYYTYQADSLLELRYQCSNDIQRRKSKRRKEYIKEQKEEYLRYLDEKHKEGSKQILKTNKAFYERVAKGRNEVLSTVCLRYIREFKESKNLKVLNIDEELDLEFKDLVQEIELKYKFLDNEIKQVVMEVKDVDDDWNFVTQRFYRLNGNWKSKHIHEKNGLINNEWNPLEDQIHEKIKAISKKHGVPFKCWMRKGFCLLCEAPKSTVQFPNKGLKRKKIQISMEKLEEEKDSEEDPNFKSKVKPSVLERQTLKRTCCKKLDFSSDFYD